MESSNIEKLKEMTKVITLHVQQPFDFKFFLKFVLLEFFHLATSCDYLPPELSKLYPNVRKKFFYFKINFH